VCSVATTIGNLGVAVALLIAVVIVFM
jgi:hypothetical protein